MMYEKKVESFCPFVLVVVYSIVSHFEVVLSDCWTLASVSLTVFSCVRHSLQMILVKITVSFSAL